MKNQDLLFLFELTLRNGVDRVRRLNLCQHLLLLTRLLDVEIWHGGYGNSFH